MVRLNDALHRTGAMSEAVNNLLLPLSTEGVGLDLRTHMTLQAQQRFFKRRVVLWMGRNSREQISFWEQ